MRTNFTNIRYFTTVFFVLMLVGPGRLPAQPIITNLTTWQQPGTKLLDIDYDLSTSGRFTEELTVRVSRDGGETFETVPQASLSGAVGRGLSTDTDLNLVWDAATSDWAPAFYGNVQVEVTVTVADGMTRVEGGTLATTNELDGAEVGSFYIGRYEVTWSEWNEVRAWAIENGYGSLTTPGQGCAPNHPVHSSGGLGNVLRWCNAKSEKEGLTPVYMNDAGAVFRDGSSLLGDPNPLANGYRLPLEAEWEFAARGGNASNDYIYAGSNDLDEVGWYWENSDQATCEIGYTDGRGTWPVGRKRPNALGLYDMSGNILERCWGSWGDFQRVRGGAWRESAEDCRVDYRGLFPPGGVYMYDYTGFRLARNAAAETREPGSDPDLITERFTVRSELFTLDLRDPEIPALQLGRESQEFPWASYAGQQLRVHANRAWMVATNAPWITLDTIEGEGDDWIVYSVAANSDFSSRQAVLAVTSGDMEASFTVIQQGAPAPTTWYSEASDLGDNWRFLPWLRSFNISQEPWIFHPQHGWLYPFGDDPAAGMYFWDVRQQTFLYTSSGLYPTMFRFSDGKWIRYQLGSSTPRWFVDLQTGVWEQFD